MGTRSSGKSRVAEGGNEGQGPWAVGEAQRRLLEERLTELSCQVKSWPSVIHPVAKNNAGY